MALGWRREARGPRTYLGSGHGLSPLQRRSIVKVWDVATGEELFEVRDKGFQGAFSPDGRRIFLGSYLLDAADGREIAALEGHHYYNAFAFSPDGKRIALLGHAPVTAWDTVTGQCEWTDQGATNPRNRRHVIQEGIGGGKRRRLRMCRQL